MSGIVLAIEALGVKHGGGATVLRDLIDTALQDSRFERIVVFGSPRKLRSFDLPRAASLEEIDCSFAEGSKLYRLWWMERRLPRQLIHRGCDVLLCLSGCGSGGANTPHVSMIQNSLPFSMEYLRMATRGERLRWMGIRTAMRRSCRLSQAVIVQTQTMKDVVNTAFDLPPDRIRVITPSARLSSIANGESSTALGEMRSAPTGFRLLYVGNTAPHKNVQMLLTAVAELKKRIPEISVFLTWPLDFARQAPGARCIGYLRDAELTEAYALADALVMPSLQETVALPLLEAMASGTPVIAADRPYAREVCQEAAQYFDPHDVQSMTSALEAVLTKPHLCERMTALGLSIVEARRGARPYEQVLDVLAASSKR